MMLTRACDPRPRAQVTRPKPSSIKNLGIKAEDLGPMPIWARSQGLDMSRSVAKKDNQS